MLLFKLALVALSIFLASQVSKQFGHAVGGTLAGMPVIAGPIMAVLLMDHGAEQTRDIAWATLVCLPGTVVHILTFAYAAQKGSWRLCLGLAMTAFFLLGTGLLALALPLWAILLLVLVTPGLGLLVMPKAPKQSGRVAIPSVEIFARIIAAITLAGTIIVGADYLPPAMSGLLLAVPIAGSILPCFTLRSYGYHATVNLLAGFLKGLYGFCAFFIGLIVGLPLLNHWVAFSLALVAALAMALLVYSINQRLLNSSP
jgi:hypothetical protein